MLLSPLHPAPCTRTWKTIISTVFPESSQKWYSQVVLAQQRVACPRLVSSAPETLQKFPRRSRSLARRRPSLLSAVEVTNKTRAMQASMALGFLSPWLISTISRSQLISNQLSLGLAITGRQYMTKSCRKALLWSADESVSLVLVVSCLEVRTKMSSDTKNIPDRTMQAA